MKNLLLSMPFLFSFLLNAQTKENSKDVEPTLQVNKAFEKDFPKIKPNWRKEFGGDDNDELDYEANFNVNNTNMTAVYTVLGIFRVLEVEIKTADIPAKISSYLSKNYPKNTIKKVDKVITNSNKITYDIGITINEKWVDVVFDKECEFLKMIQKDK